MKVETTWTKVWVIVFSLISTVITYYSIERVFARLDLRDAKFITADRNEKREIKEAYTRDRTHLLRLLKHCEKIKTCEVPNELAVASPEVQMLPETMLMLEADRQARKEGE